MDLVGFSYIDHEEIIEADAGDDGHDVFSYFFSNLEEVFFIIAQFRNYLHVDNELTNFFNNIESAHEDDALREVAALVCPVRYQLPDADSCYLISSARYHTKFSLY